MKESEENNNPNQKIDNSGAKTVSGNKILEVRITRNNREGLQIHLKSPLDLSFFARKDKQTFKYHGIDCYRAANGRIDGINGRFIEDNGYYSFEDFPNLQLFLAKNLKEGATFNFGILPFSSEKSDIMLSQFKEQIKAIYFTYCAPINVSLSVTSQIIDREQIDN